MSLFSQILSRAKAVCSAETAFAGHAALRGQNFAGTCRPVLVGVVTARTGDFVNDAYRRYVAFAEPLPSVLAVGIAAGPAGGSSGSAAAVGAPARGRVGWAP